MISYRDRSHLDGGRSLKVQFLESFAKRAIESSFIEIIDEVDTLRVWTSASDFSVVLDIFARRRVVDTITWRATSTVFLSTRTFAAIF